MRSKITFRRPIAALILTALLALLVASPVLARSNPPDANHTVATHRPDAWARYYGFHDSGSTQPQPTPWVGNNIYNSTGKNQTAKMFPIGTAFVQGEWYVFQVRVQNDGATDRFKVHAPPSSGFKYFHGSTNITAAVVAGTFRTPSLAHGGTYTISVQMHAIQAQQRITATSTTDSSKSDTVKVDVSCPDAYC